MFEALAKVVPYTSAIVATRRTVGVVTSKGAI